MHLARCFAVSLLAVALVGTNLTAERQKSVAIYSAQFVNLDSPVGTATGQLQIQLTRWSTDAERDQLMNTLLEQGPNKLLGVLSKMPSVGSIRAPDSVGYTLRYARQTVMPNGVEQVTIINDRPIGFWERRDGPVSVDYPFTVIEFRINSNGQGEGKLSIATKILGDKSTRSIALENFNVAPLILRNVRKDKQ